MRPRLGGRGKLEHAVSRVEHLDASMRPRLGGRGKATTSKPWGGSSGRFNEATAWRPWKARDVPSAVRFTARFNEATAWRPWKADDGPRNPALRGASMRPRLGGRGKGDLVTCGLPKICDRVCESRTEWSAEFRKRVEDQARSPSTARLSDVRAVAGVFPAPRRSRQKP